MADQPIPTGLPSLAGLQLAIQQAQWAALADLLMPGAMLTARVGDPLGGNTWQLQLAGRSIIAESPVALQSGSTVQLEVIAGGELPTLRLVQPAVSISSAARDPAIQLARLGLPDAPAERAALHAFSEAGAPLAPTRLAEAAEALRTQPGNTALATAYATVARSGLPAMPLTIDLALRAALPQIPSAATVLPVLPPAIQPVTTPPVSNPTSGSVPSPETPAAPTAAAPPAPTAAVPPAPNVSASKPSALPPSSPQPTGDVHVPTSAAPVQTDIPSSEVHVSVAGDLAPLAITPDLTRANPQSIAPKPVPFLADPLQSSSISLAPDSLLLTAGGEIASPQDMVTVLRLAGLRNASAPPPTGESSDHPAVHHQPSQQADDQPGLMTRVAQAMVRNIDAGGPTGIELRAALVETAAHTVFPPADLVDYDHVLPLPLQERGAPVPARLAVSTRTSAGGSTATWLRVDTELSQLGPVSARLAAIDHGPLIVHLVSNSAAHEALTAVLPELEAALKAKGFTANIRLSVDDG